MQYPVTVVLNKAITDIEIYAREVAKNYNLPMDMLSIILENVASRAKNDAISVYSCMNIETFNSIDKLNTELNDLKNKSEPDKETT